MNKWIEKWLKVYLKCYINLILYHRDVYPQTTFNLTTFQGFNLPQYTPINRNETLQKYIEELISDILVKLTHVYRICICINDNKNGYCIEKYILDFGEFKHLESVDQLSLLKETDVFDEFRSSLNSLISKLEKLDKIKSGSVSFEVVINTLEMDLGHGIVDTIGDQRNDQVLQFERDTNWTKVREDENLPNTVNFDDLKDDYDGIIINKSQLSQSQFFKPKIKMISLVGCDFNPFVIYNFIEQLVVNDNSLDEVYVSPPKYSSL